MSAGVVQGWPVPQNRASVAPMTNRTGTVMARL
jgi:hypothetical protein